jgi:hypothetical protein
MKKAQVQLGETIFIIIFILLIIIFAIVFFSGAEKEELQKQQSKYAELSTVSLAQYASSLSELSCSKKGVEDLSCYDLRKLKAFALLLNDETKIDLTREYYFTQFGNAKIEVQQIYPSYDHILLYENRIYPDTNELMQEDGKPVLVPLTLYDSVMRKNNFGVLIITKYTRPIR